MAALTRQEWREKRTIKQTPEFRVAFPNLFTPQESDDGGKAKYNMVMLFDKKTDISALQLAAIAAATEKWGPKEKRPKGLVFPFKDGDDKADLQGYAGKNVITCSSIQRPAVVGGRKGPDGRFIRLGAEDVYGGMYAVATIEAVAYEYRKTKDGPVLKRGVMFQLSGVQKRRDGDRFGGGIAPELAFEEMEESAAEAEISFEDTDGDESGDGDLGLG